MNQQSTQILPLPLREWINEDAWTLFVSAVATGQRGQLHLPDGLLCSHFNCKGVQFFMNGSDGWAWYRPSPAAGVTYWTEGALAVFVGMLIHAPETIMEKRSVFQNCVELIGSELRHV